MSEWVTLHLASPHMKDGRGSLHGKHEVEYVQHLLTKGGGGWGNFEPGKIDGEYGLHSAQATHRAKYWLGYKKSQINGAFGNTIATYLNGGNKLPLANRARRKARLVLKKKRAGNLPNVMLKAHNYMKSQVGYHESPTGSNLNKFGAWYGANGVPWCAISATYAVVVGAGYSKGVSFARARRWAYVPYIVADARSRRNGLEVVSATYVKQGDLCCYDWEHNGTADHVEFFDAWISHGSSFYAVGGNTGPASKSNGGEVAREVRYVSEVQQFVRAIR